MSSFRQISRLLSVIFAVLCFSVTYAYDFSIDGIYYTKLSDGFSVQVSNKSTSTYVKSTYTGDVIIPESVTYKGLSYNVTSIGQFAFYNSEVTSVSLPNGIISIGDRSFAKSASMTSCDLPQTVTSIGSAAFSGCTSLQKINIPKGVSTLNLETFYGCNSITEVTIPNTVMRIAYASTTWANSGSGALNASSAFPCFANCKSLKNVIFEDGDRPLSFVDATPGYTTSTGCLYANEIFYGCPIMTLYLGRTFEDAPVKGVFQDFSTLVNVTFGLYVTGIQDYAFQNCRGISKMIIPSNVVKLGNSVFSGCTNLVSVFLGDGISDIPYGTFSKCTNLDELYVGNGLRSVDRDVFSGCTKLKTVLICSTIIEQFKSSNIPSNVKFYVPQKDLYTELLKDNTVESIGTISGGVYDYTGTTPNLNIVPLISTVQLSVSNSSSFVNAGIYNEYVPISICYSSIWNSSFSLLASFSISKIPLTIIANDASKRFGTENPELSCSFFGFKNGENQEVLIRLPNVETTASATSNVGAYPIIPYGAEAQNYTFNYERGTLTITKADQMIEWEQQFGTVNVGDVLELTAISSAGLPVKYTSTDESIADIFIQSGKTYVEFLKPGHVSIRATQDGNENYNEADRVSIPVTVISLIKEVTLNQKNLKLIEGETFQLTAVVTPSDVSNKQLEWSSTNPDVASVDENGKVTAIEQGTAVITVTSTDGSGVAAVCEVSVCGYSGIEDAKDGIVSVYVSNRTIHFDNVAGLDCRVIHLNGSEIYFNNSNSEYKEFSPPTTGTYIVIVGLKSYKIMMQD